MHSPDVPNVVAQRPLSAEVIRYRAADAIKWLQTGAQGMRSQAKRAGNELARREGVRTIGKDLSQAAGALLDVGKSAVADLMHASAQATEYALHETYFEVVRPTGVKAVNYSEVRRLTRKGDDVTVELERGGITIHPPAHVVSARVKAPVGWSRNGVEVPYDILIEELAARCGQTVSEA